MGTTETQEPSVLNCEIKLMAARIGQETLSKVLDLLEKFKISVCFNTYMKQKGAFDPTDDNRIIYINPQKATAVTFLHEVGHVLVQPMCCREHDEYAVYGVVVALGAMLGIEVPEDEYQYAISYSTVWTCPSYKVKLRTLLSVDISSRRKPVGDQDG